MAIVTLLAGSVAWNWADDTPPSFVVAMWVMPAELHAGDVFTIREIYVRNKLCARHIDHGFSQDAEGTAGIGEPIYGMYRMPSPDDLLWPTATGLLETNFDAEVPVSLQPGKATYIMSLVWTCWWNPISYLKPYRRRVSYDVMILPDPELPELEGFIFIVPQRRGTLVQGVDQ